ncbi:hypothetical protein RB653_004258 [Dictyostelium firmibasis]|uniref:Major facilitator superfamily (MFS) profile domain-containing protein n=1 Tax=Dictyostelium firmibasis TaxID=79012 RepID=A0AAN7U9F9_9MYCE
MTGPRGEYYTININNNSNNNNNDNCLTSCDSSKKTDVLVEGEDSDPQPQPQPPLSLINNYSNSFYNICIVFLVLFLSESARGLVLPTTPSYVETVGGDSSFLGIVVSSFSLGRFISTILLGYLSSKLKYRKVFIGSVAICIVGSILYCFAYLNNGAAGKIILIISRLLLGFGAGTLSAVRAYIAEISTPKERTTYIAWASAVQFFGFAITPIIGSALQLLPMFYIIPPISVNTLTSPGWFLTIFNSVLILILIFQFSNPKKPETLTISNSYSNIIEKDQLKQQEQQKDIETSDSISTTDSCISTDTSNSSANSTSEIIKKSSVNGNDQQSLIKILINDKSTLKNLIIFIVLNFFVRGILGIFETLGTPIYLLLIDDKDDGTAGYYFGGMGIVGILILLGISYVSKRELINDFWILLAGNVIIVIGCAICVTSDLGWVRFTIGSLLIWGFGYPLAQTIIVSMFSKTLSSSVGKASQGTLMGVIGMAGSLGRIIGPLISGMMFTDTVDCFYVFFFSTCLAIVTLVISFLILPSNIFLNIKSFIYRKIYNIGFIKLNENVDDLI